MENADASKFQQIELLFRSEGFTDTLDLNSSVKIVRELRFSTSQSSTMISGGAATYDDLVDILDSACAEDLSPGVVIDDAQAILKVTNQLTSYIPCWHLVEIFWIQQCDW